MGRGSRVGAILAPASIVDGKVLVAHRVETKGEVTGSHTRSTSAHNAAVRVGQVKSGAEEHGAEETGCLDGAAVVIAKKRIGDVDRPGNMTLSTTLTRFWFNTFKTIERTSVHNLSFSWRLDRLQNFVEVGDIVRLEVRLERGLVRIGIRRISTGKRQTISSPLGESSTQDRDTVKGDTHGNKHPPNSGGTEDTQCIIDDNIVFVVGTKGSELLAEDLRCGEHMGEGIALVANFVNVEVGRAVDRR